MTEHDVEACISLIGPQKSTKLRVLVVGDDGHRRAARQIFGAAATIEVRPTVPTAGSWDVALLANVLMSDPDPCSTLEALVKLCRQVWVQDLIRAWRGGDRELSPDTGDVTRFTFPGAHEARIDDAVDLCAADQRFHVGRLTTYSQPVSAGTPDCLKFVALVGPPLEKPKTIKPVV